jgi:hypothetical protein
MITIDQLKLSLIGALQAASHSAPRRLRLGRIWAPTIILAVVGLAKVAAPASLYAQAGNGWVGKRVLPILNDFALGIDNGFVRVDWHCSSLSIRSAKGGRVDAEARPAGRSRYPGSGPGMTTWQRERDLNDMCGSIRG